VAEIAAQHASPLAFPRRIQDAEPVVSREPRNVSQGLRLVGTEHAPHVLEIPVAHLLLGIGDEMQPGQGTAWQQCEECVDEADEDEEDRDRLTCRHRH
jgi:hypothetical protein